MAEQPKLAAPDTAKDELAGSEAPLMDHLVELRNRLIRAIIVLFGLLVFFFIFSQPILGFLIEPYRTAYNNFVGQHPDKVFESFRVIYTAPQELFFTQLNVAFFAAIFAGFPYLAIEVYGFVAPGLYKKERYAFIPYLIATPVFFFTGGLLVYYAVLPMALSFFLGMQTEDIEMLVKVSEYLGLAMTLILAFGICFQLPVVLTLLAQIDLVSSKTLAKGRRYAIVGILVFAAFITPPDPVSQIGLAVPMYLLYELSILSVKWIEKRRAARLAAEGVASAAEEAKAEAKVD